MVDLIFNGLDIPYRETRFIQPPRKTYAVYQHSIDRRGADDRNMISENSLSIELYSYKPDSVAEKLIEHRLDELAMPYEKQERYWIESEQLYQVIYSLDYITKGD